MTTMNRAGARAGAAGAFGMGLFVGIVAAPCVGGFIVGLLAFVAARQDAFLGFLFFFTLSIGLGLPYLFLAAYSRPIGESRSTFTGTIGTSRASKSKAG